MKKIFLLAALASLMCACNLFTPKPDTSKPDDPPPSDTILGVPNSAGARPILQPAGVVWQVFSTSNLNGTDESPYDRWHFAYDDQQQMISKQLDDYRIDYNGQAYWQLSATVEYTYGTYGLTKETWLSHVDDGRTFESGHKEYYYTDGLLTLTKNYSGGNLYNRPTFDYSKEYEYTNGLCTTYKGYNSRGQLELYETYAYDEQGVLTQHFMRFPAEYPASGWDSVLYVISYDAAGREAQIDSYKGEQLVARSTYEWNQATLTLTENHRELVNGTMTDYYQHQITYNEHGNQVRNKRHYYVESDGSIYRNADWDERYYYQYDAQGRVTCYEYDNTSCHEKYLYSYDETYPTALTTTPAAGNSRLIYHEGQIRIQCADGSLYDLSGRLIR